MSGLGGASAMAGLGLVAATAAPGRSGSSR